MRRGPAHRLGRTLLLAAAGALIAWMAPPVWAIDTTPPSAPGQPLEGASPTVDEDFDRDGSYTVFWTAASDPESGIASYELQEKLGASGTWKTLSSTIRTTSFAVSGRAHNTQYLCQARARNRVRLWGPWSPASDGILVDLTAPSTVTVTDDGATTGSTTQLHAAWTASSDPESGIAEYHYQIRQDSPSGALLRDWTSVGLVTEVTATGLSLVNGTTYYLGVRAQNRAGAFASAGFSDGITVDSAPPTGSVTINGGAAATNSAAVTLTLAATDNSGTVAQMQFSNDGTTYSAPEPYATSKTWTLASGDGTKTVWAQFSDPAGNWSSAVSDTIVLDTIPPTIGTINPQPSPSLYAGDTLTLSASVTDTDPTPLEYQFSIDGAVTQAWSATTTYQWITTSSMDGSHTIMVEVRDAGGAALKTQTLYLYATPPGPP